MNLAHNTNYIVTLVAGMALYVQVRSSCDVDNIALMICNNVIDCADDCVVCCINCWLFLWWVQRLLHQLLY